MIRSAIRRLLAAAAAGIGGRASGGAGPRRRLRARAASQPVIGTTGPPTKQLVAALAADAFACLGVLDGHELAAAVTEAAELLATVARPGPRRRRRRPVPDRSRGAPRTGSSPPSIPTPATATRPTPAASTATRATSRSTPTARSSPTRSSRPATPATPRSLRTSSTTSSTTTQRRHGRDSSDGDGAEEPKVYGDSAYGTGEFQQRLEDADIASGCRTQPPSPASGRPVRQRPLRRRSRRRHGVLPRRGHRQRSGEVRHGSGLANFAEACATCELRPQCTDRRRGAPVRVGSPRGCARPGPGHAKPTPVAADYRATRPKVERKLGHLMRRRHGGRRARVRARPKVDADFNLLAAAANVARLAVLGLRSTPTGWATAG